MKQLHRASLFVNAHEVKKFGSLAKERWRFLRGGGTLDEMLVVDEFKAASDKDYQGSQGRFGQSSRKHNLAHHSTTLSTTSEDLINSVIL